MFQPDITAPGVNIIAAYSELSDSTASKQPITPYNMLSGTSMSCPHVAGVVGLLKALHPNWSPAAIKSAIITSGKYILYMYAKSNTIVHLIFDTH